MLLQATDLSYTHPDSSRKLVFPDVELQENEQLLILGKSGSGKTTLLHLLALLLPIQKGQIKFTGNDLIELSKVELSKVRAENTGIVHQKPIFVRSLSCRDNITLSNYFSNKSGNTEKLKENARKLEVEHLLDKKPDQLSGGEQQRMTILRAIAHSPKIIFADEPTSNLDDESCEKVYGLLSSICKDNGTSLIIVTHDKRLFNLVPKKISL